MVLFFRSNSQDHGSLIASLRDGDYTPQLIMFSTVASAAAILTSISLSISYAQIAGKPASTLVQTNNGALTVEEQHYLYRTPATIREFTGQTLSMLLNWNGKTLDRYGNLKSDPGVDAGGQNKIPTLAYEASNAFTTDKRLRTQVVERISNWMTPDFLSSKSTQRLEIKKIGIPQKLKKKGHWRVNVISTRYIKKGSFVEPITFNKVLFLRAIPIINNPSPETATPEQKAFYKTRAHGLEVYRMQSLERN